MIHRRRTVRFAVLAMAAWGTLLVACGKMRAAPGDPCSSGPHDDSCVDPTHRLSCRAFTWHLDPCRGERGCSSTACDQSVALKGDSCSAFGDRACSVTGEELLRCDGAHMVVARACRGERGCYREAPGTTPMCDPGLAVAGDPCEATAGGRCGSDGKSLLECSPSSHTYVFQKPCLGPKGCFQDHAFGGGPFGAGYLGCDVSVGEIGGPCQFGPAPRGVDLARLGFKVCSTDRQQVLTCDDRKLVPARRCPCTVEWDKDARAWSAGCEAPAGHSNDGTLRSRSAVYLSLAEHSDSPVSSVPSGQ
jgi:hypothetical protein